jgi:hypothetical protein
MASLLSWVGNQASKAYDQVNPFDNGLSYKTRQVNHAQPPKSVAQQVKPAAQGVVNMTGAPAAIDAARLAAAQATHNQAAAGAATQRLATNLPQFLPIALAEGVVPFAQSAATAVLSPYANRVAQQQADYARQQLARPTIPNSRGIAYPTTAADRAYDASVEAYANSIKQNTYRGQLAQNGIKPTDSNAAISRKVAGQAVNAAASIAFAGKLPGLPTQTARLAQAGKQAAVYGALSGVSAAGQVAQMDNPTANDYARAVIPSVAAGAALPLAIHGARVAIPATARAAAPAIDRTIEANRALAKGDNRGILGGSGATGYKAAKAKGQVFEGVDGKPRFEVDDSKAKTIDTPYRNESRTTGERLGDILDHPALYKQYPELKDLRVIDGSDDNAGIIASGRKGGYDPETNTIRMGNTYSREEYRDTLLHEIQHVIQTKERFAPGGTPDKNTSYSDYQKLAGEAESRAVSTRSNLTPKQRQQTPFYDSVDIPKSQLRVLPPDRAAVAGDVAQPTPQPSEVDTAKSTLKTMTSSLDAQKYATFDSFYKDFKAFFDDNNINQVQAQTIYDKAQHAPVAISKAGTARSQAELQSEIERAHNAGDTAKEAELNKQLKDPAMSSSTGAMTPERRAELMAKMQANVTKQAPADHPSLIDRLKLNDSGKILVQDSPPKPPKPPKAAPSKPAPPPKPPKLVRSFPETVKDSPNTLKKFAKQVKSIPYKQLPNDQTLMKAAASIKANENEVLASILQAPEKRLVGGIKNPDVNTVTQMMLLADKYSREGNYGLANQLIEKAGGAGTDLGRAIQIFSAWNKTTPAGILKYANNLLKKNNVKLPDSNNKLPGFVERAKALEKMPEGHQKDVARAKLIRDVDELVPSTPAQKASQALYLAQLLNPKTAIRNVIGNTLMVGTQNVADTIGAPLDAAITGLRHIAGQKDATRTTYVPNPIQQTKAFGVGLKRGTSEALQGISSSSEKMEAKPGVFRSKVGRGLERTLGLELSAVDKAFKTSAEQTMLRNMTKARGLKVEEATPQMKAAAEDFGRYMTFNDDTALARLAQTFKTKLNELTGSKDFGLGNIVLNYPRTPSNILLRAIDFSPVGFARGLLDVTKPLIHKGAFDQRAFVQHISQAAVGTTGLVGTGYILHNLGILTTDENKNKKDVGAFDQATGLGKYKINVSALKRYATSGFDRDQAKLQEGDHLISYDWAQPAAVGLAMGANIDEQTHSRSSGTAKVKQTIGDAGSEVAAGAQTIVDQPLLQGVQRLFNTNSPTQGAIQTAESVPASFVPSLVRGTRYITDPASRNTYSPTLVGQTINNVRNAIPGASKQLPQQTDAYGNPQNVYQPGTNTPFNVFLNPAISTSYKPNNIQSEIKNVYEATGDSGAVPNPVSRTYKVTTGYDNKGRAESTNVVLTQDQYKNMQSFVGSNNQKYLTALFNNPDYQKADPQDRATMIGSLVSNVTAAGKVAELGGTRDKATQKVQNILDGRDYNYTPPKQVKVKTSKPKAKLNTVKSSTRTTTRKAAPTKRLTIPKFKATNMKAPRTASFKYAKLKSPSFKRTKIPSYAVKTPKVRKALA